MAIEAVNRNSRGGEETLYEVKEFLRLWMDPGPTYNISQNKKNIAVPILLASVNFHENGPPPGQCMSLFIVFQVFDLIWMIDQ
jgi:hypothetical protein